MIQIKEIFGTKRCRWRCDDVDPSNVLTLIERDFPLSEIGALIKPILYTTAALVRAGESYNTLFIFYPSIEVQ